MGHWEMMVSSCRGEVHTILNTYSKSIPVALLQSWDLLPFAFALNGLMFLESCTHVQQIRNVRKYH